MIEWLSKIHEALGSTLLPTKMSKSFKSQGKLLVVCFGTTEINLHPVYNGVEQTLHFESKQVKTVSK